MAAAWRRLLGLSLAACEGAVVPRGLTWMDLHAMDDITCEPQVACVGTLGSLERDGEEGLERG